MLIKFVFLDCCLPETIGPQFADTGFPSARDSPTPIIMPSTLTTLLDLSFLALAVDVNVCSDQDL